MLLYTKNRQFVGLIETIQDAYYVLYEDIKFVTDIALKVYNSLRLKEKLEVYDEFNILSPNKWLLLNLIKYPYNYTFVTDDGILINFYDIYEDTKYIKDNIFRYKNVEFKITKMYINFNAIEYLIYILNWVVPYKNFIPLSYNVKSSVRVKDDYVILKPFNKKASRGISLIKNSIIDKIIEQIMPFDLQIEKAKFAIKNYYEKNLLKQEIEFELFYYIYYVFCDNKFFDVFISQIELPELNSSEDLYDFFNSKRILSKTNTKKLLQRIKNREKVKVEKIIETSNIKVLKNKLKDLLIEKKLINISPSDLMKENEPKIKVIAGNYIDEDITFFTDNDFNLMEYMKENEKEILQARTDSDFNYFLGVYDYKKIGGKL